VQGGEAAAVSICRQGQAVFAGQQCFALEIESRQGSLLQKADILRFQAKEGMLFEELPGRQVIGRAGHDIPGEQGLIFFLIAGDALSKELEQRGLPQGGKSIGPLRSVEAQPGTLSTGNRESRDHAGGEQLPAALAGVGIQFFFRCIAGLQRQIWRRLQLRKRNRQLLISECLPDPRHDLGPVLGGNLAGEVLLLGLVEFVPEAQQMALPHGRENFLQIVLLHISEFSLLIAQQRRSRRDQSWA